jgi:hypothetical protein
MKLEPHGVGGKRAAFGRGLFASTDQSRRQS